MRQPTPTTTPTISVSFDELTEIFELAAPRFEWFPYPQHPLVFSCSPNGVWPTTRRGYVPPAERCYVTGRNNILDTITVLIPGQHCNIGGRFIIDMNGARTANSGEQICHFEVGA